MSPLMLALILLLAGLCLAILEVFIPSAGVLGFVSVVLMVGAVIYAYLKCDMATGTAFLAATVVLVPILIGMAIRVWPHTPIGRMVLLDSALDPYEDEQERAARNALVGQRGIARSRLLPGGIVEIDGQQLDVVIIGSTAEKGDLVEVVEVEGNHVLVTRVDENERPPESSAEPSTTKSLTSLNDEIFEDDPFA
ncbi:NfeD family protein [Blastopirellula marina]|uniref:NfeD-like C-terminal domain-containing protein n=1 Tax=Blastopirellula marina TaxID=124 RepID=A0A2S8FNI6_9BACT|nr:NfeD family protein [Blastopirellula marina]PQO33540.1 hypothetical protein C5Y98_14960 [Blastopirellula marina]PTL43327.1 hypothetical protein C5Y97_14970 [Blastopirellula marina]